VLRVGVVAVVAVEDAAAAAAACEAGHSALEGIPVFARRVPSAAAVVSSQMDPWSASVQKESFTTSCKKARREQ